MGTKQSRHFETLGHAVKQAEALAELACSLKSSILLDDSIFETAYNSFVLRQADIFRNSIFGDPKIKDSDNFEAKTIFNAYELHEEILTTPDEWMYELEAQNVHKRFQLYNEGFDLLKQQRYEEALKKFNEFLEKHPDDELAKYYVNVCTLLKDQNKPYCRKISKWTIEQFDIEL